MQIWSVSSQSVKRRKGNAQRKDVRKVCARKRQESFRTVTWNLAGLAENSLEPFFASGFFFLGNPYRYQQVDVDALVERDTWMDLEQRTENKKLWRSKLH